MGREAAVLGARVRRGFLLSRGVVVLASSLFNWLEVYGVTLRLLVL